MRSRLTILMMSLVLVHCGSGTSASLPGALAHGNASRASVTFHIAIPRSSASSLRRPAYVSSSTASLVVSITDSSGHAAGGGYLNMAALSSSCITALPSTLSCSLTVPVNIAANGAFTFVVGTYDQAQTQNCVPGGAPVCVGNVLSQTTFTQTLSIDGANTVSLTLDGIPASITFAPLTSGYLQGTVSGLTLWGAATQQLSLAVHDAAGNTIVGPGSPAITLSSPSPAVTVSSIAPGVFALQATVGGSPPVVTPGALMLTATATSGASSGSVSANLSIPLAVMHSAVLVSNVSNVVVYLDGNTTPSNTLTASNTLSNPRGVATDPSGTLFVANHGNSTISVCPAPYTACTAPIADVSSPEGLAFDIAGNLWVANSGANTLKKYASGATTSSFSVSSADTLMRGVAVDGAGNVYDSDQGGMIEAFSAPVTMSSTASVVSGLDHPVGIATDAHANLWVAVCGANCGGLSATGTAALYPTPITATTTTTIASADGMDGPQDVAIDANGALWVADHINGAVVYCPAPVTAGTCSTAFTLSNALWLTVVPGALVP